MTRTELYGHEVELPEEIRVTVKGIHKCPTCGTFHPRSVYVPIDWRIDCNGTEPATVAVADFEPVLNAISEAYMKYGELR